MAPLRPCGAWSFFSAVNYKHLVPTGLFTITLLTATVKRMDSSANTTQRHSQRRIRVLIAAPSLEIYGGQALMAARLVERLRQEPTLAVGFQPHNPRLPRGLGWLQRTRYVRTLATTLAYFFM